MANRDGSGRSSLQVITAAGFAAYAVFSFAWAALPMSWSVPMIGQGFLYLAVTLALLARVPWAGWFALGIATGGLLLDVVFLFGQPWAAAIHMLDTAAQLGLLALAIHLRRQPSAAPQFSSHLTDSSAPRIGWTFALTAAALPGLGMAALAPGPRALDGLIAGCFSLAQVTPAHEQAWLTFTPVVALLALGLLARLRTLGLVVLFAGALGGLAILFERWTNASGWAFYFPHTLRTEQVMATVGQLLLLAAVVPLAGPLARSLLRRDR